MVSIKIMAGFTCSLLIVLFTLSTTVKNQEINLYEETIESIMAQEGLSSVEEVIAAYPELKGVKSQMRQLAYLNNRINSITANPAPNLSKEESQLIQNYPQRIHQLRSEIKEKLSQIKAIHSADQP